MLTLILLQVVLTLMLSLTGEREQDMVVMRDVMAQLGWLEGTRLSEVTLEVLRAPVPTTSDPNQWMIILAKVGGAKGLVTKDPLLMVLHNHANKLFIN